MRKEGVEGALRAEVQDLRVVRMVKVREDAQELPVDVLDGRGEVLREFAAWTWCSVSEKRKRWNDREGKG